MQYVDKDGWVRTVRYVCHIGDILKEKDMTIDDLCKVTGMQKQRIKKYIENKNYPNIGNAFSIADALNVPITKVWTREL